MSACCREFPNCQHMNQSNYSNDYDPDNPPDEGYSYPAKRYVKGADTNWCEDPEPKWSNLDLNEDEY